MLRKLSQLDDNELQEYRWLLERQETAISEFNLEVVYDVEIQIRELLKDKDTTNRDIALERCPF